MAPLVVAANSICKDCCWTLTEILDTELSVVPNNESVCFPPTVIPLVADAVVEDSEIPLLLIKDVVETASEVVGDIATPILPLKAICDVESAVFGAIFAVCLEATDMVDVEDAVDADICPLLLADTDIEEVAFVELLTETDEVLLTATLELALSVVAVIAIEVPSTPKNQSSAIGAIPDVVRRELAPTLGIPRAL